MSLLAPPWAPSLAAALEAVARREPDAGERLAEAVALDEEVLFPTSDDGRHPLATGPVGKEHLTAFTGLWMALWAHPDRPPMEGRPVREVLGWVVSTGVTVRLDHASEADTLLSPPDAVALLDGRAVDVAAVAAGDPFRNPGPPAAPPDGPLPAPPPDAPGDAEVTFARRWDPAARQPVEPVPRRDLEGVGAGYTAIRRTRDGLDVVTHGTTVIVATTYAGGEVHRCEWARFTEGLFLTETSTADDDGSPRPRPRTVVLTRPDGLIRYWRRLPDGSDMTTSSSPDMTGRWIGVPPLGTFDPLVAPASS